MLSAFDPESADLNAVIEAVRGSRNEFKYDDVHGVFISCNEIKGRRFTPIGRVGPRRANTLADDAM